MAQRRAKWAVRGVMLGALMIGLAAQAQEGGAPEKNPIKVETRPYDTAKLAADEAIPANVYRGRTIWLQRCAYCHDGVGQPSYHTVGPFLAPEITSGLGDAGLRQFLTMGTENMPSFQYTLSPAQMDDVIAYVKTIPANAQPTEDQLAGRLPGAKPVQGAQGSVD
ncbi:c-type cytochrome [Novosphingobium sediminicola]|uniref:Mono/diheme cytochrome c family protein n=1 Tax=Novosphingobium sediminicola TaxID=563162 RepID=A0A7W6CDF7_9SPHN|nr:cytochrome c [Novosphingobium sediminicola]MBB3953792.1 mono/diheme cytochrome c family protein [Novosphingobium sediminicola]